MSQLETVPEDDFVESSPKKELDETLVEDHAVVAEDVDLQRELAAADVVQEIIVVHEQPEESESEYNETELDVDEQSSSEEEMTEDTSEDVRRKEYLAACSTKDVIPISSFLKSPGTTKIALPFHGLGDRSLEALLESMQGSNVETLDLKENRITGAGVAAVAKPLSLLRHLVELDLSNNNLGPSGAVPVCTIMRNCASLQKINLSGNAFGDKEAGPLAEELGTNTHLLHANLSHNAFGELGGLCFGAAIQNSRTLLTLDLSWNQIRRNGGMAIANAIRANPSLTHLDVSWNAIGDIGALAMAEALKLNSTLQDLNMTNNTIGSAPCLAFAKALTINSTLTSLHLGLNPLTNEGVLALIDAVKANHNVTTVDLSRVPVMQSVRDKIDDLLRPSPRLQAARLSNRRASIAFHAAEEQRNQVKQGWESLAEARAALAAATTPFARVIAKAKIEAVLRHVCDLLPSTALLYFRYAELATNAECSFFRGGRAAVAAREAIVSFVVNGKGRSSSAEAVSLARAAARAELPDESEDAIETIVRDAVYGTAAAEAATRVYRTKLQEPHGSEAAAIRAAESVFDAAYGPALASARQAYSSFRAAHPKDPGGAIVAARDAYVRFGGSDEYDLLPEIVEEEATSAAREAMYKSLQISTRASEQEAGLENACKVYKAAQGKREPSGAAFLQDVIELFLAEKALNEALAAAVEQAHQSYQVALDANTSTSTELEAALEHDVQEGRRPGLVFMVDEASGGHLKSKPEVDPFLLLEQYIERRNLRLVDMFLTFDNDRSGKITYEEFVKGIKAIGLDLKPSQITYLIEVADLDGDGTIDYQEFSALRQSTKMQVALEVMQKRAALKKMQSTKEGKIAFGHMSVESPFHKRGGSLSIFQHL